MKLLIYFFIIFALYRWMCPKKKPFSLDIYFGIPGSGKTTLAAYFTKQANKQAWPITLAEKYPSKLSNMILDSPFWRRRKPVYSNVPITGAYQLDCHKDLGRYMVVGGLGIVDEAGIDYNNRKTKDMSPEEIYFFKYYRHYEMDLAVFSQSHEDMDITLRRLASSFYLVKKSLIPGFVVFRRIYRKIGIDKNTHQIIDMFYFMPLGIGSKWIYSRPLWKLFNSFSRKQLPEKKWEVW